MRGSAILLVALALPGCAGGRAAQPPASVQWDDEAAMQARGYVESTMHAFAAMDLEAFKDGLAEDVVGFEMDVDSEPVRLGSRADAARFAEQTFLRLHKMGAKPSLRIYSSDCRATSTLAWCTVSFDFTARLPDGGSVSQPTWNTVVLRKGDDGWKWIHWHSSLAVAAAPAVPAGPPAR